MWISSENRAQHIKSAHRCWHYHSTGHRRGSKLGVSQPPRLTIDLDTHFLMTSLLVSFQVTEKPHVRQRDQPWSCAQPKGSTVCPQDRKIGEMYRNRLRSPQAGLCLGWRSDGYVLVSQRKKDAQCCQTKKEIPTFQINLGEYHSFLLYLHLKEI